MRAKTLLDDAYEGKPPDLTSGAVKPLYVPDTLTLIELLETFTKHRQHLALVLDEYGELQGLVTMNDVIETLVGEVATVEEGAAPDILRRADGSWLVDGNVAPERFREAMQLAGRLPAEDTASYHTLGGFAMMQLGRIPQVGDRFECQWLPLRDRRHGPEPGRQAARHSNGARGAGCPDDRARVSAYHPPPACG